MLKHLTNKLVLLAFVAVLLLVSGVIRAESELPDSALAAPRRGDINADGAFDIQDLVAELGWMRADSAAPACADLNADSRVDVFDLLALLLKMRWLGEDGNQEFKALATIDGHLVCEPLIKSYLSFDINGERNSEYIISSNREISRVEFVIDGDTLTETIGWTPVLMKVDPDTIENDLTDLFAVSDPKHWSLKVWDMDGNCFEESWISRFACLKTPVSDFGGSPNTGLPIDFPLVLHGPWQRFALIHPVTGGARDESLLTIDLNPEGADSVMFGDIDALAAAIMERIAAEGVAWQPDYNWQRFPDRPIASPAVTVHTNQKEDRLLFYMNFFATGGYIVPRLLDSNERLLSALGFPRWIRQARQPVINNNYKLDPEVYEKYKYR